MAVVHRGWWGEMDSCQRLESIGMSIGALGAVATVGAMGTSVVVGGMIPVAVFTILCLIGGWVLLEGLKKSEALEDRDLPFLGEWSANQLNLIGDVGNSTEAKLDLVRQANECVDISGSYCGGEVFDRLLDILEEKMSVCQRFSVRILSCEDFVSGSQVARVKEFAQRFHGRISFVMTRKEVYLFPFVATMDNHVKLMVVDGRFGVLGGGNLCDAFSHRGIEPSRGLMTSEEFVFGHRARDIDVVVEGPIVERMSEVFNREFERWGERGSQVGECSAVERGPLEYVAGGDECMLILGRYEQGSHNRIKECYLDMIRGARETITIAQMTFSHPEIVQEVKNACLRGVRVEIVTNICHPGAPGGALTLGIVNLRYLQEVVAVGGSAYGYIRDGEIYHKKVMVVDQTETIFGSFNIARLSCIEDELVMRVRSRSFAEQCLRNIDLDQGSVIEVGRHTGFVLSEPLGALVEGVTGNVFQ